MSGLLPSFLSAAQLEIRIGSAVLAYCQSLAFTDDMTTLPVGGIGSYSYSALEPVSYIGRGSTTITHYSKNLLDRMQQADAGAATLPENLRGTTSQDKRDGNSLLTNEWFNPVMLMISRTFDIKVYLRSMTRSAQTGTVPDTFGRTTGELAYTLKDCRMNSLSFTFTPGSLINQVASFICLSVIDHTAEDNYKYIENRA